MNTQKIKKIANIALNAIVWVFVVLAVLVTVLVFTAQGSKDGVPAIFGKSFINIETPSMEDTYKVGDLVFLTKLSEEDKADLIATAVTPGEDGIIITFRTSVDINGDGKPGDLNTHRIYSHESGSLTFVTKGDNSPAPDNEGQNPYTVHLDDIIGICTEDGKIGGLGNVMNFLRSSLGFFLCIVLPMILFFLYELYNFISIFVKARAERAAEGAKESEEDMKRRVIEEYLRAQAEKDNADKGDGNP